MIKKGDTLLCVQDRAAYGITPGRFYIALDDQISRAFCDNGSHVKIKDDNGNVFHPLVSRFKVVQNNYYPDEATLSRREQYRNQAEF